LRYNDIRSRIDAVSRLFKLGLAVVLAVTLTAPPAAAQGDDGWGWSFGVGVTLAVVLVVVVVAAYAGYGISFLLPKAPFSLAEETVEIKLSADRVRVAATYVFQNDGDEEKTLELAYPFGQGRGVGPAENVTVTDGAGEEIPFAWKKKKITFPVAAAAAAETPVQVTYEQPLSGTTFKYLLGKDRFWGLGGAFTTVTVTAPVAFGNISASYPLESVAAPEDAVGYVFVRDDFYPDMNFTLRWKRPPAEDP
jgi:hypothetical protein